MVKKIDLDNLRISADASMRFVDIDNLVDKDFVKNLRSKLQLTQFAFATILGVKKKTIEKWEQGKNPVRGPAAVLLYLLDHDNTLLNSIYSIKYNTLNTSI
jgi:putative transcriptional regulator